MLELSLSQFFFSVTSHTGVSFTLLHLVPLGFLLYTLSQLLQGLPVTWVCNMETNFIISLDTWWSGWHQSQKWLPLWPHKVMLLFPLVWEICTVIPMTAFCISNTWFRPECTAAINLLFDYRLFVSSVQSLNASVFSSLFVIWRWKCLPFHTAAYA